MVSVSGKHGEKGGSEDLPPCSETMCLASPFHLDQNLRDENIQFRVNRISLKNALEPQSYTVFFVQYKYNSALKSQLVLELGLKLDIRQMNRHREAALETGDEKDLRLECLKTDPGALDLLI